MARPAFVICDTDAVIQFLLAPEIRPFQLLRSKYSIQPLVVREVEIELQSNKRFGPRISHELKKALGSGLIRALDKSVLESHYGGPPSGPLAAAQAMGQITKLGAQFQKHVDLGEAYTHAAAVTLGEPALSHDLSALKALITAKQSVPGTVLRAFDLIVLCYQVGHLTEQTCDGFRQFLNYESEYIPRCFQHKSFVDGLADFSPRLHDPKFPAIGRANSSPSPYSNTIVL